jgi:putative hemolysin
MHASDLNGQGREMGEYGSMRSDGWIGEHAISYAAAEDSAPKQAVIRLVERLSGKQRIVRAYLDAQRALRSGDDIFAIAMRTLELSVVYDARKLEAIPRTGPLVVVANHPFGVIDGLVLCHLIRLARPDFKVVAMSTLCRVPEVRDHVLPINFAETRQAAQTSAQSRRAAKRHLESGGCLIIFPAGAVSTARRVFGPAEDGDWHPFVGRLVQSTRATTLPVYFRGQNSLMFQLASRISPTLRLSLLMQEAVRRIGTEIEVHVGRPIGFEQIGHLNDPKALTRQLRAETYALSGDPRAGAFRHLGPHAVSSTLLRH